MPDSSIGVRGASGELGSRGVRRAVGQDPSATAAAPSNLAQVSIVVPTRNEEESIDALIERLSPALDPYFEWEVVVVDDSDDATPERVRRLGEVGYPVRLVHRGQDERGGGLSSAVFGGFDAARFDVLVVMDADLQHPPEQLRQLIEPVLRGGADIAVGSRYVAGGSAQGLDGPLRWIASRGLQQLTRLLAPKVNPIHDPLSGFFALRRDVLRTAPRTASGFKILLELLVFGDWSDAVEVPIRFGPRVHGESKASASEGAALLRQLGRMRWNWATVHLARSVVDRLSPLAHQLEARPQ